MEDAINLCQLFTRELELVQRANRIINLCRTARADQGSRDFRVAQNPGECHLRQGLTSRKREIV